MVLRVVFALGFMATSLVSVGQEINSGWNSFPSSDTNTTVGGEGVLTDVQESENTHNHALIAPGSSVSEMATAISEVNVSYTESSKHNPKIKGYTVLLFSGSGANSKLNARNMLIKFESQFPSCETHLAWKSPNYEVRVGNFRTKLEAERLLQIIKTNFPTAFVKTAMIELPTIDLIEMPVVDEK